MKGLSKEIETVIRQCSWKLSRQLPGYLTRDDLEQVARIAIWQKTEAGALVAQDETHHRHLLKQVAARAMIDERRRASQGRNDPLRFYAQWAETEAPDEPDSHPTPEQTVVMRDLLAKVRSRCVTQGLSDVFDSLCNEVPGVELSAALGLSARTISVRTTRVRQIAAQVAGVPACH